MPDEVSDDAIRLLVVEDDAATRDRCSEILRDLFPRGVHVDLPDGRERALDLLAAHRYDAILADHQLAWMDGVQLLSLAARQHPRAARILLARPGELGAARGALDRARVHAVILKPLRLVALREALRHVAGVHAS